MAVKRHYTRVQRGNRRPDAAAVDGTGGTDRGDPDGDDWDKMTEKAMRFGMLMSPVVKVIHVDSDDSDALGKVWEKMVLMPVRESGHLAEPELVTVTSNFRTILSPLMDYVLKLEDENPGRKIAVLLPELVVKHWWENLLHNQRVQLLKLLLLLKGNQRIVVVNIPWYL